MFPTNWFDLSAADWSEWMDALRALPHLRTLRLASKGFRVRDEWYGQTGCLTLDVQNGELGVEQDATPEYVGAPTGGLEDAFAAQVEAAVQLADRAKVKWRGATRTMQTIAGVRTDGDG